MSNYSSQFYDRHAQGMQYSARTVLPLVFDLMSPHQPRSVVDVGCGEGHWLSVASECGASDCLGLDGDYVQRDRLAIPADRFIAADLTHPPTLDRRFDLAMCLEVGEHLPHEHSDTLVTFLTSLAPVVLFSAAIPRQGGTHHVNEQWPGYWFERFSRHGMLCADALRRPLWDRDDVEWWYAQNVLLFVHPQALDRHPRLREVAVGSPPMRLVHPTNFLEKSTRSKRKTLSRRIRAWITGRALA